MRYPDSPQFLLDENTSPPTGGGAAPSEGGASASGGSATPPGGGAAPSGDAGGAEAAPSPAGGHDPFDGMESNDYYDSIDLGPADGGTGDEPGPAPAAPAAPAGAEPVQPPVTAAPPAAPQAAPPATAPAAAAPAGDAQAPPRSQLDQAMEGLKTAANQTALSDWAAQNLFKLSDEEIAAYEADPGTLIPKLMGRVYTNAMQSAVNLIKNLVPEMVNSGITTQASQARRASEALNEFYQSNPHLSADQHGAAVDKWARSFRATNPNASRAEAIAFVGKAVSAEFGIWPSQNGSGAPAPRRAAPFAPARQGGRAPAAQKGPHDQYAGMEDEYD
jgi:hypothetical protein